MTAKKPYTSVKEVTHEEEKTKDNKKNKTRILVVDDDTVVRQRLIPIINQQFNLVVCAEAENAIQALEVIEKQEVDFAIVNIWPGRGKAMLTEKIKLQCPNLPILILSIQEKSLCSPDSLDTDAEKHPARYKTTEKIIAALRYVQSLLSSQISGFSIFVSEKEQTK